MAERPVAGTEGLEERRLRRAMELAEREGVIPKTPVQMVMPSLRAPGPEAPPPSVEEAVQQAFGEQPELDMKLRRAMVLYDRETGEYEDDENFAARYLEQETILGPSMDAGLRATLAFWGDTPEERKAVFEHVRPQGEMMEVPGTEIVVFKEHPDEPWRKVDQGVLESLSQEVFWKETGRDITELVTGPGPEMLGEALALMVPGARGAKILGKAARVPGPGIAVKNLFRLMLGNITGGGLQEVAQRARGTARETLGEVAARQTQEALGSGIGAGVGGLLSGTFSRVARTGHAGMVGARPGAAEAVEAMGRTFPKEPKPLRWYHRDLRLRPKQRFKQEMIPLSHLTDQPLIQRVGRIAAAIMPRLNRYTLMIDQRVTAAARAMIDPARRHAFMVESLEQLEKSANDVVEFTRSAVKHKAMHPVKQGELIQDMIQNWWMASKRQVDALYATARALHDPEFDLSPALRDAEQILARNPTPGKPITVGVGDAAEEIVPLIRFGRAPSERLQDFIKRLKAIDEDLPEPDLPEGVTPPSRTDRIRSMVQELDDMAQPGSVGEREPDLLAKRLSAQLRDVLENPIGGDANFNRTWKKATRAAKRRFDTREKLAVIDAVDSDTPSEIVHRLLVDEQNPATIERLIQMRRATSKEGWNIIRQEYKGRVLAKMRDPDALEKFLDNYQPYAKRMLLDPAEERVIRANAATIRKLYKSGLREAADQQSRNRAFIKQLTDRNDTAGIDAMLDFVQANPHLHENFQHAIMDEIIEKSIRTTKEGVDRIGGGKMKEVLEEFGEKGLLDLLSQKQLRILDDTRAIQLVMDRAVEDAGTSLTGAATAKGVFQFALSSIGTAVHMIGLSRVLTSPWLTKVLIGTAGQGPKQYSTRRAAMMVGAIASHLMRDIEHAPDDSEAFAQLEKVVSLVPRP